LLARLDSRTARLVQELDPNASPASVAVGGGAVWVTDTDANNVTRVDPTGLSTPITVGIGPSAIAVGEGAVWVADTLDGTVTRIDPSTTAVTTTIPVGRSPSALAVGGGSVWVANGGDGTITRIDPDTDQTTATIRVGGSPRAIAIGGGRVWASVDAPATTATLAASGGTLRMETLADLDSLDPALAYSAGSWQLLYATCAKLLNYPDRSGSAGSELTPEVATGLPTLSADGTTYTFTVRPGFRFSPPSDQPVTAQTFKSTIERTLNPRMKSPIAYEFANLVGAVPYMAGRADHISGVQARGDKLNIHLLAPEPDIPSRLAQPFFCAVPTNTPIDPGGLRAIPSAGPYHVTSYIPGQSVVLARNPNYGGSRPHRLARIVLALGVSSQRAVADIESGRADYTSIGGTPASTVSALAARLAAQYGPASPAAAHHRQQYFAESQHPELDFLILNTHRPLFSDLRLRQAVNYAIDRQALARLGDGFGSADRPATQYLPPGIPGFTPSAVYPITPNLTKARALTSGRGRTAILYACNYAACRQLAQIVSNDLARIGLRVETKAFDHNALYARLATPNEPFDIAFGTWLTDYPDPASMLNGMLADRSIYPTFNDPVTQRALAATGRLTGPERYLAFGRLALRLARDAAPIVAYGNGVSEEEFFSSRIGCQTYAFYVGVDLAALCSRPGGSEAR
jgi:peptide/nickel transport system substrate-binding protein